MKVSISRSFILPVISSWGYILLAEAKENTNSQSPALGELSFHWCSVQQICGSGFNLPLMRTKIYVVTECTQKLPMVKISFYEFFTCTNRQCSYQNIPEVIFCSFL